MVILIKALSLITNTQTVTQSSQLELSDSAPNPATQTLSACFAMLTPALLLALCLLLLVHL